MIQKNNSHCSKHYVDRFIKSDSLCRYGFVNITWHILFEQELCSEKDMIIVELSLVCRRQPTVGGADSSVSPVTHIISPDHSLQLSHSVVLRLVLTAVEQLFFHSCPHTFTACIIMTSSAGAVHALNDPIFLYSSSVLFACILTASVRVDDTAFYIRIWFVCVFKSMAAERSSHIIFNSYPQRHQIKLVFFVDLHHFICKHLILPGGVFMAEMIIKCLSCNLQSLAVKTDTSCDPTVISLFGNEL